MPVTLKNYAWDIIGFRCGVCYRYGRYKRSTLIERLGEDFLVPRVYTELAKGCPIWMLLSFLAIMLICLPMASSAR